MSACDNAFGYNRFTNYGEVKMDTNLIAFETLKAAQETAKWTYWMMFATWFAGAATFSAVGKAEKSLRKALNEIT
ncbi:hypothetical protein MQ524_002500 [Salmonella enterica]|nr:hypothetical protein [Salmonella enterica subsp. enterica serovar Schwarzengrund]EIP6628082.1 hypothetical protein [Salmonella enterica subsp. enterica serovar Schwarzengrund]EIZ8938105.1 hypothetical protein [Salmonella enterica]